MRSGQTRNESKGEWDEHRATPGTEETGIGLKWDWTRISGVNWNIEECLVKQGSKAQKYTFNRDEHVMMLFRTKC